MKKTFMISTLLILAVCSTLIAGENATEPQAPENKFDRVAWTKYWAEQDRAQFLGKASGLSDRRSAIHNGNRVRTLFYNYGSVGRPNTEPSMEWPIGSGRGYAFEFGVIAGARVVPWNGDPTNPNDRIAIVSDGLRVAGVTESNVDNTIAGDWQPLSGYHDPYDFSIAMSDAPDENRDTKPDNWPSNWYNSFFGDYMWPGEYGLGVTTADQESYYVMDDYYVKNDNSYWPVQGGNWGTELKDGEFYPGFPVDTVRGGLGLEVHARGYQWVATRAQNVMFFVYELINVGQDTLKDVYFGMYGDPHIGGAVDYADDDAYYDTYLDMVYAWDDDARGGSEFAGTRPGFFGYKFLESPGEPRDGIDNDEDGMIDESMQDGIDNDGDWRAFTDWNLNGKWDAGEPVNDDTGIDGVGPDDPQYVGPDQDGSEANGIPDLGEPNFDSKDLDEADQIGLTSFVVETYTNNTRTSEYYYNERLSASIKDSLFAQNKDNIFMYSSGPIVMAPDDSRRFSITMLFGYNTTGATGVDLHEDPHNTRDLYATAAIMQQIYNAGYRFVKPPIKPRLTAVPGDGKVTLYWDDGAEKSRDPLYGNDFEGYAIYRATDFGFNEALTITDTYGSPYLWKPIAKFDLKNNLAGPHPVEQIEGSGLHYDMGRNSGLVHSFVDEEVINGQRYFYAVCAYDSGAVNDTLPPTETSKTIQEDFAGNVTLDVNTAVVTPAAPSVGFVAPDIPADEREHDGPGSGMVEFRIIDPTLIPDNRTFQLQFTDSEMDVVDNDGDWETFTDDSSFISNGPYVDLIIPPTSDTISYESADYDTIIQSISVGDQLDYMGLKWLVKSYDEGGGKDTVIIYPDTVLVLPTLSIWDPAVDGSVNDDVGADGCSDEYEDGLGGCADTIISIAGLDPNGDNWHPMDNPSGTEADGQPTSGEPDLDFNDLQEKMRDTQFFTVCDVTDVSDPICVMEGQTGLNGEDVNAISNGFQVYVYNDTLMIDEDNSRWINGDCLWEADIEVYTSTKIKGSASPNDYEIEFYETVVDTPVSPKGDALVPNPLRPMTFVVRNTITGKVEDVMQIGMKDSTLKTGNQLLPIIYQREDKTGVWAPTWRFKFTSSLENITSMLTYDEGVIIGTEANGIHIYNIEDESWNHQDVESSGGGLIANVVYDIQYFDGFYWIATNKGPSLFDGNIWHHNAKLETMFDELAPDNLGELEDPDKSKSYVSCKAIEQDSEGWIWLATRGHGLFRVNTQGTANTSLDDSVETYTSPDTININIGSADIVDLLFAEDGTLWMATSAGVVTFDRTDSTWATYTTANGLQNNKTNSLVELDDGAMVVGTEKGLAFIKDGVVNVYLDTDGYLPNRKVHSVYHRNDSELYVGTYNGYAVFDISGATATGDYSSGITSESFLASWGDSTIYQDDVIKAITFSGDIGYFGTRYGPEIRLSEYSWNSSSPQPGDIFQMKTRKPFSNHDTFTFNTYGGVLDEEVMADNLSKIAVVPNPYVATAVWEQKPYLSTGRGERKVWFTNLPPRCTIRIFNMAGELIQILEHDEPVFNGSQSWDLLNIDNMEIAYGIYIFHVETDDAETIGKFAVIK